MRIIPAVRVALRSRVQHIASVCTLTVLIFMLNAGCQISATGRRAQISVTVHADGRSEEVQVPIGSTVAATLELAGVPAREIDKSEPPSYVVLEDGADIHLIRVEERFRTETRTIPFDRQVIRNESLPEGQERLVQAGINGEKELTYKEIFEDGIQTSSVVVKTTTLGDALPEIVMIGSRSSYSPIVIPGRLAYVSGGSAWLMENSTANRLLLSNTGDLDGRVLSLSPDGSYLLYSRRSTKAEETEINTLWAVNTKPINADPAPVNAANIIHFAAWDPTSTASLAFSTVEPRAAPPGWQANNDLYRIAGGGAPGKVLDAQSGGVYGWWGTSYAFSPNGRLAYSRPDGIGLVIQDGGYLAPIVDISPLRTHGDWAWVPGIAWGADSETLFFVDHALALPPVSAEESPIFDLKAVSLSNNAVVSLVPQVGMFASPSVSPVHAGTKERSYQVAFLQAIFPEQSDVSRYRLVVMDRDGSDRREVFPSADLPGLEPQRVVWAPGSIAGQVGDYICVIYKGNLWLIDTGDGQARQITGDGLISGVDWK